MLERMWSKGNPFAQWVVMCMHYKLLQFCLFVTLWTLSCHASLSMGFSRQEFYNGWPHPPPGALPNPGIEPVSLMSPAVAGRFFTSATWEAHIHACTHLPSISTEVGPAVTKG